MKLEAVPVSGEDIYWVGAIDWGIRDFHGYTTHRGTTYNAYLILGDRPTLIDTVKRPFADEMMARIRSLIDPSTIDCIVSDHSEMDHTGSLPWTIETVRPSKILASKMGAAALLCHFPEMDHSIVKTVGNGETIDLSGNESVFMETRMLHWPDSMFTFLPARGLLFSQDAFGMHLASSQRFDDELDRHRMREEAAAYYANILQPYSPLILKLLDRVSGAGLDIRTIAPDHGPVWRGDPGWIIDLYAGWAGGTGRHGVVIVYDTMWGSTGIMARAIAEGARDGGAEAVVIPMSSAHRSDVATQLLEASVIFAGSPTLNNDLFPTMADTLTYLRGLKPAGLSGMAFGSYGWSGESVARVEDYLSDMKVPLLGEGIRSKYVPDDECLALCIESGRKGSELALEAVGSD